MMDDLRLPVMGPEEMAISYKQAKNKVAQVGILAELNCITKKEVREILRGQGFEIYEPQGRKPENSEAKNIEQAEKQKKPVLKTKGEKIPEVVMIAAYEKLTELKMVVDKYEKTVTDAKEGIEQLEKFLDENIRGAKNGE